MKDDGGQAFPSLVMVSGPNGDRPVMMGGMSLRDYFAAAALQGAIASPVRHTDTQGEDITELADYARLAYGYADALLAEREKP